MTGLSQHDPQLGEVIGSSVATNKTLVCKVFLYSVPATHFELTIVYWSPPASPSISSKTRGVVGDTKYDAGAH